jgi:hypothetical protein
MGVNDIITELRRRINGGGKSLLDYSKLYDTAKELQNQINEHNKAKSIIDTMNVNPIIEGLNEQFGPDAGKILTIQNFEKLKGLRFGGEYQVKLAHESMGNYTFIVQNLSRPSPQNEELFRLRRVPEVKDLRLYRLSLQNRRNFITLPRKIIENPALLLQEMYALVLGESNPF